MSTRCQHLGPPINPSVQGWCGGNAGGCWSTSQGGGQGGDVGVAGGLGDGDLALQVGDLGIDDLHILDLGAGRLAQVDMKRSCSFLNDSIAWILV